MSMTEIAAVLAGLATVSGGVGFVFGWGLKAGARGRQISEHEERIDDLEEDSERIAAVSQDLAVLTNEVSNVNKNVDQVNRNVDRIADFQIENQKFNRLAMRIMEEIGLDSDPEN